MAFYNSDFPIMTNIIYAKYFWFVVFNFISKKGKILDSLHRLRASFPSPVAVARVPNGRGQPAFT